MHQSHQSYETNEMDFFNSKLNNMRHSVDDIIVDCERIEHVLYFIKILTNFILIENKSKQKQFVKFYV